MDITKKHIISGVIILFIFIFIAKMPMELSGNNNLENVTNSTTANNQSMNPEEIPLMSTPDNTPAEEKRGWWKHDGHSSVSGSNEEQSSGITNEDNDNNGEREGAEIPEFPFIAAPMLTIICIAMLFSRK